MELSSLILFMVSKMNGERSKNACLHIFRGKKSSQTLQDVQYFNLKPFFSVLSKLDAETYETHLYRLLADGYVKEADGRLYVSKTGLQKVKELDSCYFNGWDYRGNEIVFFHRLALAIQTISYFKEGIKSFMPIQTDREVQLFVKGMARHLPLENKEFPRKIGGELKNALQASGMKDRQKLIIVSRLSGFSITGRTWDQLAEELQMSPLSVYLEFIEGLHRLLDVIHEERDYPFLLQAAEGVKSSLYLTDSADQTRRLFAKGMNVEEIATVRRLKLSTIEDHFVEMAINDKTFPLTDFVLSKQVNEVVLKVEELGTRRLRMLKQEFGELSYFQLRLILGSKLGGGK
ncbi:ATP-dependent DNA helicase RecQ [Sporosarcina sp. NCCP-2222]|uniref:helix-turn-helix domain-containing protein n=1 Tax=Sporosarcina sp. NCCP-2222 TaxID=2935073 RepID=UPI00208CC6C2|nr:helix-turn-helix domain-containing protein [Sporosarcina sp. NCCP-2222]GKV55459.1 ATP-dependent DNA helicase RecQ [Sporosarcina sp. NCCP-2222]